MELSPNLLSPGLAVKVVCRLKFKPFSNEVCGVVRTGLPSIRHPTVKFDLTYDQLSECANVACRMSVLGFLKVSNV